MDQPILSDKTQFPTEEIIYSHLGKAKNIWISFFEYLHENHPDTSSEWRYYNDGKSWLMKVTRKKKRILVVYSRRVFQNYFLLDRQSRGGNRKQHHSG